MTRVEAAIQALPADARTELCDALHMALLWRGHDRSGGLAGGGPCRCHACDFVAVVAAVFARHGVEFEEYT